MSKSLTMSHNSSHLRPNEEALTALLVVAALCFGGLFSVVKTVGNRFAGSTSKEEEHRNQVSWELVAIKKHCRCRIDGDGTSFIQNNHVSVKDSNNDAKSQTIQTIPQLLSSQRNRNRREGSTAIRTWEKATNGHVQREEARRSEHLPSFNQREIFRNQGEDAVLKWEQSMKSRFQQDRARRLSSLACAEINQENGCEAVNAGEPAARRDLSRRRGVEAVEAWAQDLVHRSRLGGVGGRERLPSFEDDGRIVLWRPR